MVHALTFAMRSHFVSLVQHAVVVRIDKSIVFCAGTSADAGRCGRPPRFLEQLEALYGDHNRNMGIFMSTGRVRSSTPPSVFWLEDLGGPSSYNYGDKRCTMDHVVNSP